MNFQFYLCEHSNLPEPVSRASFGSMCACYGKPNRYWIFQNSIQSCRPFPNFGVFSSLAQPRHAQCSQQFHSVQCIKLRMPFAHECELLYMEKDATMHSFFDWTNPSSSIFVRELVCATSKVWERKRERKKAKKYWLPRSQSSFCFPFYELSALWCLYWETKTNWANKKEGVSRTYVQRKIDFNSTSSPPFKQTNYIHPYRCQPFRWLTNKPNQISWNVSRVIRTAIN